MVEQLLQLSDCFPHPIPVKGFSQSASMTFATAPISARAQASVSSHSYLAEGAKRVRANAYHRDSNPSGILNLGVAENQLMWPEMLEKLNETFKIKSEHLQYPLYHGSEDLRGAITTILNDFLKPELPNTVLPEQLQVTNGCGSAISVIAGVVADVGEGILTPAPYYGGFYPDLEYEVQVKCVGVNCAPPHFRVSVDRLDEAYHRSVAGGTQIRALLICSPNNPCGICYSRDELIDMMKWCAKRRISLISDEIYAGSVWGEPDKSDSDNQLFSFTSVLAIDSEAEAGLPASMVHVLWGLSKDFNVNGLRVGVIQSRNKDVIAACRQVGKFHAIAHPIDSLLSHVLSDASYVSRHVAANNVRIREMHTKLSKWLSERGISAVRANAGFFVWIDLRKVVRALGGKVKSLEGAVGEDYFEDFFASPLDRTAERDLWKRIIDAGVYIALGEAFYCRDLGWFRIVYSTENWETLELGLNRMWSVLSKINADAPTSPPPLTLAATDGAATATPTQVSAKTDPLRFSHMGLYAADPPILVSFYTKALGFTITDVGVLDTPSGRVDLTFTSRSPYDHHQIVIASGRPKDLQFNVVNQISLDVSSLAAVRRFTQRCIDHGATDVHAVTHGNAVSVYLRDPEGNRIELFMDTPWYINQPHRVPIPGFFGKTDVEVMRWVEEHSREDPGFEPREYWVERMKERMKP